VSYSAVQTLREAGCEVVAMTTPYAEHQSYAPFAWWTTRMRVPLLAKTEVVAIHGRGRVDAVTVRNVATGAWRDLACDTVVFTGDWIPDHELARLGGIEIDVGTRGPAVDAALRTSRPNVFAAGNLLHGAEMADVAALEGVAAAKSILGHLSSVTAWPRAHVPIVVAPPLVDRTNRITDGAAPPRPPCFARDVSARRARDRRAGRARPRRAAVSRLVPNRWYGLEASWRASISKLVPSESARSATDDHFGAVVVVVVVLPTVVGRSRDRLPERPRHLPGIERAVRQPLRSRCVVGDTTGSGAGTAKRWSTVERNRAQ
jgi:hypothetical protein